MKLLKFVIPKNRKKAGFSMVELLVAMGISAIVLTSALGVLSSIYFSQKQVLFSHDYYSENRFLMERVAQLIRNNTLDYDRMFEAYGPSTTDCLNFNSNQLPAGYLMATDNNNAGRQELTANHGGYKSVFYWDTDNDGDQDRNLGGKLPGGADDNCTQAWDTTEDITTLYLINSARTIRHAIRMDEVSGNGRVVLQKQYSADTDNDGVVDLWGPHDGDSDGDFSDAEDVEVVWDETATTCSLILRGTPDEEFAIKSNATDEDYCVQAHEFVEISPQALDINALTFTPTPNRDPYLAFRVDEAQVHPVVFISMETELKDPDEYGFSTPPTLSFQTAVSSRVYGDIR